MIQVDVNKIDESIRSYTSVLNVLVSNDTAIEAKFNELKNYWNNPNSIHLYKYLGSTTRQVKLLENDIKAQLGVYNYISNCYKKLGNKVKFNNDNESSIDYKLNVIVDQFESVLSHWGKIGYEQGNVTWFPKSSTIYDLRSDYLRARDAFDDIKEAIDSKMNYIKNVEKEVSKKISNIDVENILVNDFDLNDKKQ